MHEIYTMHQEEVGMKVAYFDCFAGASGDMILGALMDAGLDVEVLKRELAKLHLSHFHIGARKVVRKGIGGTQALVTVDEHHHGHHHRHLSDIRDIIHKSDLEYPVKIRSVEIFTRLAEAEARVHRTSLEEIHFHEVGAMDAILDVVGSVAGLAALKIEKVYCSPFHVGTGSVRCAHGVLPVPAPATAELIREKPAYATGVEGELLTPTGAAILTTVSSHFGPMPSMKVEEIGYGAGTSERSIPNLLRVMIGEARKEVEGYETEQVAVLQTNIDDMNPQIYDYLMNRILGMGALDIFLTPVQMKKNRPGILVTLICPEDMVSSIADVLLRETTSIGLRWRIENRIKAQRTIREAPTRFGTIRFKVAQVGDRTINIAPEYEDCKRVAVERNVTLKEVMDEARAVAAGFATPVR